MKCLAIGGVLFGQALRHPGLVATALGGALLILSLAWVTGFGLGREFQMIRESTLGTAVLFSFACSVLAAFAIGGARVGDFLSETVARTGSSAAAAGAAVLGAVFAGIWANLVLVPFVVGSLAAHAKVPGLAVIAVLGGAASFAMSVAGCRTRMPVLICLGGPGLIAAVCAGLIGRIPGGSDCWVLLAMGLGSTLIASSTAGLVGCLVRGAPGGAVSIAAFLTMNVPGALPGFSCWPWWVPVPDLSSINPSSAAARSGALGVAAGVGALGYGALVASSLLLVAQGVAAFREASR